MLIKILIFILIVLLAVLIYRKFMTERTGSAFGGILGGDETFESNPKCNLDNETVEYMRNILNQNKMRPEHGGDQTDSQHVEHCFHQLIRFANLAKSGHDFRAVQFGLNLGRAQEILGSYGGVECWWRLYEPLIKNKEYDKIISETEHWLNILELSMPSDEFINRV